MRGWPVAPTRIFVRVFLAPLLLLSSAHGQPAAPAATIAQAEALIRESGAEGVFAPEESPAAGLVSVRHVASGLRCRLNPANRMNLTVYPRTVSGAAHGEDVSCTGVNLLDTRTYYATRYPTPQTLDAMIAFAAEQVRTHTPSAEPMATPPLEGSYPAAVQALIPESRSQQFVVREGERAYMTRVSVAIVDGWVIKQRWSGALGTDNSATMSWNNMLIDLVCHRRGKTFEACVAEARTSP
jgi:hypothetical protein